MVKRRSFAHEREARAILSDYTRIGQDDTPTIKEVPLDINDVIHQICISLDAADWFRDVVQDLVTKYGLGLSVDKSEMNAIPLY